MTTKLKKLWLFVASAVMAITAIFAVGCESNDGEGNACATHTYGEWVIVKEPTDTEKGLRKHTCTVCGNVEEEEVQPLTSAVTAAIKTPAMTKGTGIDLTIEPFTLTYTTADKMSESGSDALKIILTRAQTIDCFGGYAYLGIGDDGLLYAYGKYSIHSVESVTTIATGKTETTDNGVGEVSFLLDKDTFYLAMTVYEKDEATGKYTVKNEDESMMKSGSIDDFIAEQDGWLQTAAQLILRNTEKFFGFIGTDLRPFAEKVAAAFGMDVEEAQKLVLSMIFSERKTDDGYVLTDKENLFLSFSNDVTTLKINALLDKYFGAGTYAKLEALPEILDWKIGDTMTLLAAKGITVEKITAIADTATKLLTGDDTATLKGVTGLDLNEIIDSYKDVTLGELLAKLSADEEVDYEAKATDLLNTLRSFYYNLSQVADPYGAETDGSDFEATYNEKWAQFKTTYPDSDWEHYVALVQEAYKTKAGDTAYAQYFGADCTKKLLVKGMMTALDDTNVFSAATVAIANELNPNYGKTEEEIAAEEKAALAEKVNAMKNTLQSILTAGKTCTLPELIEQATKGSVSAQMIKLGLNTLAAELDKGVSLKLMLNLDRTITGFEISLTKDLLATICEMSAEIETDGTTSVKTGFRISTGLKLSVSCGAEKAAHKADFNAEEFVKLFPSQPETDGGNTDGGNTDTTAYAA